MTLGGRADFINTSADINQLRPNTNLPADELEQSNVLYSYYATNELKFTDEWKLNFSYGYAQRPPTLTERYADGIFLGLLQSGFTRVIGNAAIKPERDFQLDLGLSANYDNFHANVTGFYAWVVNYITFEGDAVNNFLDAKLVDFTNTPLATLTGFEASADFDLSSTCTPFAKAKYVQGDNQFLRAPLPAIPPLEGTLGLRWHNATSTQHGMSKLANVWLPAKIAPAVPSCSMAPPKSSKRPPQASLQLTSTRLTTTPKTSRSSPVSTTSLIASIKNSSTCVSLALTGFPAPATRVLSPGISPFFGFDWNF